MVFLVSRFPPSSVMTDLIFLFFSFCIHVQIVYTYKLKLCHLKIRFMTSDHIDILILLKSMENNFYLMRILIINPFTGQDVYRRPKLAAFPMGRTCISVLTGLAVSDTEKPRYLVL